jgi:hypothetical protein
MEKEKLKPFADFIREWRERDRNKHQDVDWTRRYIDAGYYRIVISSARHWTEIHEWCKQEIGNSHYSWTGSNFWFETQEDAFRFALRWSGS